MVLRLCDILIVVILAALLRPGYPQPSAPTAVACESLAHITLDFTGPTQCGLPLEAELINQVTQVPCPLSSGGALLCDSFGRNCLSCRTVPVNSVSLRYHCPALFINGTQILTGTYLIGGSIRVISRTTVVDCPPPTAPPILPPVPTPATPPTPPTPVAPSPVSPSPSAPPPPTSAPTTADCDVSQVHLFVLPPLVTNQTFSAILNTTSTVSTCLLSSGGANTCSLAGICKICSVTQIDIHSLRYTCPGPTTPSIHSITGTFLIGNIISRLTIDGLFFTDSGAEVIPVIPPIPGPSPAPTPQSSPAPLAPVTTAPTLLVPNAPNLDPAFSEPDFGLIPPPTPPPSLRGCSISTVTLQIIPPLHASKPFIAILNTSGSCEISSGGALICDTEHCEQCSVTQLSTYSLRYNCIALATVGIQDITGVYLLGDIYGRITLKKLLVSP